ncbi:MAG: long-chain fatty acid--CoA ligase [Acidobacteriota bacterium]
MKTLSDLVFHVLDHSAGRPDLLATKRKRRIEVMSTSDFLGNIHALAIALESQGVQPGQRVALFSENRPEWHVVDFACHLLGAVPVPIYPTVRPQEVAYILRNSGADWIFFSSKQKGQVLEEIVPTLTRQVTCVSLDDDAGFGQPLVQLLSEGAEERSQKPLERFRDRVKPEDLASIIYTSGTTGDPKGVMLTHANFVSNVLACGKLFPITETDVALSFLPLSHVFERTVDYLFFRQGVHIHYAPSIERVPPLLTEVRPTVLTSVPRLYERAYLRVTSNVLKEKPGKQRIFSWAMRVGEKHANATQSSFVGPILGAQRAAADRLVYRKIKERFGGRLRFAISGGAPLSPDVAQFFDAVGVRLFQGYGLTETAPVLAVNSPKASRLGSVGPAVEGIELQLADDGEILAKTPGLMKGYWENPTATAEVIDEDGWFHTGDIGKIDEEGFLFITDRKKDLLITSGGKNVAPQPIEQLLVSHWAIAQAVVVGDRYPYITALIVPRFEELPPGLQRLSQKEVIEHSSLQKIIKSAVDEVNERLSEHERIRKFELLDHELSLEDGEITPTLKVRRNVVMENYSEAIASMYLKTQKVS